MKKFVVYNQEGEILRTGYCAGEDFFRQAQDGEFVMEGIANDVIQKIVDGNIVDKTPEEIKRENPSPPEIPESQRPAYITNEQWQDVLNRLKVLEQR